MRRSLAYLAVLALLALASPLLYGVIRTEIAVARQTLPLRQELPDHSSLLATRAALQSDPGCHAVSAYLVATELSQARFVSEFAKRSHARQYVVWPENTHFKGVHLPEDKRIDAVPKTVDRLLKQHAFLPKGVRRMVVYRVGEIANRWDPRCW